MDPSLFPVINALLQNDGLQKISEAAAEALGNPFWIVDMNSKYLTRIAGGPKDSPWIMEENQRGYVDHKILEFIAQNQIREKTNTADSAFSFHHYHDSNQTIINCPIRIGGCIVAYISVKDECRPFSQADYEKMNTIALIVSAELQKDSFYRNNKEMQYAYFLSDLLEDHIRYPDAVKRLQAIGYRPRKFFYLLTVELGTVDSRHMILHTIQEQVSFILLDPIYCFYQNHSVFLFSAQEELDQQDPLFLRLARFLWESNLKAAVSDGFRDVSLVPRNYAKTLNALRLGRQSMPKESLYHYSALAVWHMMDIAKGLISYEDFCNGAIEKLVSYDRRHRKELTLTLYRYLEHNCRIVQTAEELGIHANTLRQRLDKIRGLTGCDLENGHQTFDLMMGLKIYFKDYGDSSKLLLPSQRT